MTPRATAPSAPKPAMPAPIKQNVGHRAQGDDGGDMLTPDALAQHERVLRADGGDQRERRPEAEDDGGGHEFDGRLPFSVSFCHLTNATWMNPRPPNGSQLPRLTAAVVSVSQRQSVAR